MSDTDTTYNAEFVEIPDTTGDVPTPKLLIGSYNSDNRNPATQVRELIGDTEPPWFISDSTIRIALAVYNRHVDAAIYCMMVEAGKYANMADKTVGRMSISYRGKFADCMTLITQLRELRTYFLRMNGVGPWAAPSSYGLDLSGLRGGAILTNAQIGGELPYINPDAFPSLILQEYDLDQSDDGDVDGRD